MRTRITQGVLDIARCDTDRPGRAHMQHGTHRATIVIKSLHHSRET